MPLMVVEPPRDERRAWAIAVAASVILHGAAFAVLPKQASFFTPRTSASTLVDAGGTEAPSEPLILSLTIPQPPAAEPVRAAESRPRAPTPDASEAPTEPARVSETGGGMGSEASDLVGEPAPAGAPGEAPRGPIGEPSGMRRGVPAPMMGDGMIEGGRIPVTDVHALEPAFDSSAVTGQVAEARKKGGGIGGFLRGVGDFLEGVEVRGGGAGGIGGGGADGHGGKGGGGKGGGCGPLVPNVGIPQGPIRPGGRVGVGMGGRPMGGFPLLMHGEGATAAEVRCSTH